MKRPHLVWQGEVHEAGRVEHIVVISAPTERAAKLQLTALIKKRRWSPVRTHVYQIACSYAWLAYSWQRNTNGTTSKASL